jgi:2'-hydroxyisoflavone reductase
MKTSRRTFIKRSAATGGALALGVGGTPGSRFYGEPGGSHTSWLHNSGKADQPKRILILGGTGFTGPLQVQYAVARGHRVSIFNRGRRQADIPSSVEQLTGDRNGDLESLKGKEWDVVIDVPSTLPRWVRDAAQLLRNSARHYVFISTISVYADTSKAGMDESTPLATMPDPNNEEARYYGAQKALAEQEAERAFPGRTTIIRPGLIVGPGDNSDRFTYWPVRVQAGGEVLAPGNPEDAVQIIDARDLAEFAVRMAEGGVAGVYNATGPRARLSVAEMLYDIRAACSGSNDVKFTWVEAGFLASRQVRPWSDMPVWVPPSPSNAGFSQVSIQRALDKGLSFRPLADTVAATLEWWNALPQDRRTRRPNSPGLAPEREAEVLREWKARTPSGDF